MVRSQGHTRLGLDDEDAIGADEDVVDIPAVAEAVVQHLEPLLAEGFEAMPYVDLTLHALV